jgi:ankyrin repeat protein
VSAKEVAMSESLNDLLLRVAETAEFYRRGDVDVHTKGIFGETPLHVAVIWGDAEAVRTLLSAGANPNAQGEHGFTPLHEAVEQRNLPLVKLLVQSGASNTIRNSEQLTPKDFAESLGYSEIVQFLSDDQAANANSD